MNRSRRLLLTLSCLGLVAALQLSVGFAGPAASVVHAEPWIHVKVIETGPDGETVRVNVPLSLFQAIIPLMESSINVQEDDENDDGEVVVVESKDSTNRSTHHHGRHHSARSHHMTINDHDVTPAEMRAMLEAFRKAEDGEYITVDGTDEHVRVTKSGGYFLVNVDDRGEDPEQVKVKIQMKVVEALLSGSSDELNFEAAIRALGGQSGEDLVTVTSEDETVHIWIDDRKTTD